MAGQIVSINVIKFYTYIVIKFLFLPYKSAVSLNNCLKNIIYKIPLTLVRMNG